MDQTYLPVAVASRLIALIRALANLTDGDIVCESLTHGMFADLPLSSVALYASDGGQVLRMVGQYGIEPDIVRLHQQVDATAPLPHCEAYRTGCALILGRTEISERFPLATRVTQMADPRIVEYHALPIRQYGIPIGVLMLRFREVTRFAEPYLEPLLAAEAALALWIAQSRIPRYPSPHPATPISDRQRALLVMARRGLSNGSIARSLGFAETTIKADLTALYRLLGATDRADLLARAERAGLLGDESVPDPARIVLPIA